MQFGLTFVLLIVLELSIGDSIKLYTKEHQEGESYGVTITSSCTNIPVAWRTKSRSIDTKGQCVYLWSRRNCEGHLRKVYQYDPDANNFIEKDYTFKIFSLQLCGKLDIPVTLYKDPYFKGHSKNIHVDGNGYCTTIPGSFQDFRSVWLKRPEYCVIFYQNQKCTKPAVRIRPGTVTASNFGKIKGQRLISSAQICEASDKYVCSNTNPDIMEQQENRTAPFLEFLAGYI